MSLPFEDSSVTPSTGGTVTSVAGGVGITGTPDPITGAGTLDLDIGSLTLETMLAAGDLFPLLDVSISTAPAATRKATLADILAGLEALGIDADTLDGLDSTAFALAGHGHLPSDIAPQGSGSGLDADLLDGLDSTAFQPIDGDLTAIAALATTGILSRTAANTWALRTLQQPAAGLTIANPAGALGDPTFALANDLAALEGLASTGLAVRTAADTWAVRTIVAGSSKISVANGGGVAGNPSIDVVEGALSLANLGSRAHTDLTGLTTGDAGHTQFAQLPGRAGGQVLNGGTADTDSLTLNPCSVTPTTGMILAGSTVGDVDPGALGSLWTLFRLLPNGIGLTERSVYHAIDCSSTMTQKVTTVFGLPIVTFFADAMQVVPGSTSITTLGAQFSYGAERELINSLSHAMTSGFYTGYYFEPDVRNTGGGSFSGVKLHNVHGVYGVVESGVTIDDVYLGGVVGRTTNQPIAGTVSRSWGWVVDNLSKTGGAGTISAEFPFGARKHTIIGTVPSNFGIWGVSSNTNPTRFYYKDDSQNVFRLGSTFLAPAASEFAVPIVGDRVSLTNQSTSITATNLLNAGVAGLYLVKFYLVVTATDAGAGTVSVSIAFNDGTAARTITSPAVAMTATGFTTSVTPATDDGLIRLGSGNIQYSTTVSGTPGAARYALYVMAERVG